MVKKAVNRIPNNIQYIGKTGIKAAIGINDIHLNTSLYFLRKIFIGYLFYILYNLSNLLHKIYCNHYLRHNSELLVLQIHSF